MPLVGTGRLFDPGRQLTGPLSQLPKLLGDRQLAFIDAWARDWSDAAAFKELSKPPA